MIIAKNVFLCVSLVLITMALVLWLKEFKIFSRKTSADVNYTKINVPHQLKVGEMKDNDKRRVWVRYTSDGKAFVKPSYSAGQYNQADLVWHVGPKWYAIVRSLPKDDTDLLVQSEAEFPSHALPVTIVGIGDGK